MTVYVCPKCQAVLTFRSLEKRERNYHIPHSDDFWCCDICGVKFCDECGKSHRGSCIYCDGKIHRNQFFEPEGIYKLPEYLRKLNTEKEREKKIEEQYNNGLYSKLERDYLKKLIHELDENTEQS